MAHNVRHWHWEKHNRAPIQLAVLSLSHFITPVNNISTSMLADWHGWHFHCKATITRWTTQTPRDIFADIFEYVENVAENSSSWHIDKPSDAISISAAPAQEQNFEDKAITLRPETDFEQCFYLLMTIFHSLQKYAALFSVGLLLGDGAVPAGIVWPTGWLPQSGQSEQSRMRGKEGLRRVQLGLFCPKTRGEKL